MFPLPFLKRKEPEVNPSDLECDALIESIGRLDKEIRLETADQIAKLWHAFLERFGGVSGYLAAPEHDRTAYKDQLSGFAARFERLRGTPQEFVLLAVTLTLRYVRLLEGTQITDAEKRLGIAVISLIDTAEQRQNRIAPPPPSAPPA